MARIRTYDVASSADITADDYLLGNDLNDGSVITKRFSLEDLKVFLAQGLDPTNKAPRGFMAYTDSTGSDVKQAPIEITEVNQGTLFLDTDDLTALGGVHVDNSSILGGDIIFRIGKNSSDIDLYQLNGVGFLIDVVGVTDNIAGTFGELITDIDIPKDYVQDENLGGDFWYINATITNGVGLTGSNQVVQELELNPGWYKKITNVFGDINIENINVSDALVVDGITTFNGIATVNTELEISNGAELNFNDPNGETASSLSYNSDQEVLEITGDSRFNDETIFADDVTVSSPAEVKFTDSNGIERITISGNNGITQNDEDGTSLPPILAVVANDTSTFQAGILADLRIGNEYYHLPVAQSQIAAVLPGLHEELSPATGEDTSIRADVTSITFPGEAQEIELAVDTSDIAFDNATANLTISAVLAEELGFIRGDADEASVGATSVILTGLATGQSPLADSVVITDGAGTSYTVGAFDPATGVQSFNPAVPAGETATVSYEYLDGNGVLATDMTSPYELSIQFIDASNVSHIDEWIFDNSNILYTYDSTDETVVINFGVNSAFQSQQGNPLADLVGATFQRIIQVRNDITVATGESIVTLVGDVIPAGFFINGDTVDITQGAFTAVGTATDVVDDGTNIISFTFTYRTDGPDGIIISSVLENGVDVNPQDLLVGREFIGNTGNFWYGVDQGTTATYESSFTETIPTPGAQITETITLVGGAAGTTESFTLANLPYGDVTYPVVAGATFTNDGVDGTATYSATVAGQDIDVMYNPSVDILFTGFPGLMITNGQTTYTFNLADMFTWPAAVNGTGADITLPGTVLDNLFTRTFEDVPASQRLFFQIDTNILPPNPGDVVPGTVYEIVGYLDNGDGTGTATFTRIGSGRLVVSSEFISIQNLVDAPANRTLDFVFADSQTGTLYGNEVQDVAGIQAVVNYQALDTAGDNGTVQSITYTSGPGCHNIETGGGAIQVDVSGRIPYFDDSRLLTNTDSGLTLETWNNYLIGPSNDGLVPPAEADSILRLPDYADLTPGDKIVLTNLTDLTPAPTGTWTIFPAAGNFIMGLPAGEELIMNTGDNLTLVWSGNDTQVGWIIDD